MAEYREGQTATNPKTGQKIVFQGGLWVSAGGSGNMRTLRAPEQKSEDEDLSAMQSANALGELMGGYQDKIAGGKLDFGPVKNVVNTVRNATGFSNEQSRNYGSFRAGLEKMRNDSLRLNKGVQTEGDAQRAWNELISNLNDEEFVKQRLAEIQQLDEQAVRLRGQMINQRRASQNVDPLDVRKFTMGSQRKPFDLSGGQSRSSIPFGAYYKDPQGNIRRNDNGDAGNPIIKPANALTGKSGGNAMQPASQSGYKVISVE